MPLTISHPVAVLPLRRVGLPMTAMVVGSMVPDLPLFLGWWRGYHVAHSLVGVATVDAAATLLVVWLWFVLARDALVDLSPHAVRSRLARHVTLTPRQWLLVLPAAWVGGLTHVLWDGFTHPGRWGVSQVAWLQMRHGGLAGYKWAQYASGVLGLVIVCAATIAYLRTLSPARRRARRPAWAGSILPTVVLVGAAAGSVSATEHASAGFHAMAFRAVVSAILATLAATAAACVAWRCLQRSG